MPRLTDAQRELAETCVPLAARLAWSRAGGDADLAMELRSVAFEALVEAVARFDPDRGYRLTTYCQHRIKGMMADWFRCEAAYRRPVETLDRITVSVEPDDQVEQRDAFMGWLRHLARIERDVIEAIYWEGRSLTEVARDRGISASRVLQIRDGAIQRLRRTHAS